jgi:hypothetical protein
MFIGLPKRWALVGIAVVYSWLLIIGLVVILAFLGIVKSPPRRPEQRIAALLPNPSMAVGDRSAELRPQ